MVDSFGDMAANTHTDTQTHRHCQILSPLALWAGGEKTAELSIYTAGLKLWYNFMEPQLKH